MNKNTIAILTVTALLLTFQSARAGSATWKPQPSGGDWNSAVNWRPRTVPNGPNDTATFGVSAGTSVSVTRSQTEVNSIVFVAAASPFTITADSGTLTLSGAVIANNSGNVQNFVANNLYQIGLHFENQATAGSQNTFTAENASVIAFDGESSAGSGTFFINGNQSFEDGTPGLTFNDSATAADGTFVVTGGGEGAEGAVIAFNDSSSAGNGKFTNTADTDRFAFWGAITNFHDSSTAANSVITNEGGSQTQGNGGITQFWEDATAGNASITSTGATDPEGIPGQTVFLGAARADSATLIIQGGINGGHGGMLFFNNASLGGTGQVNLSGNGTLDLTRHDPGTVSIGSLAGEGLVLLGTTNLTVGTNNLSMLWSGVIQGGDTRSLGVGAVNKAGLGTLTLSGANTYTGGTYVIGGGFLKVTNRTGSATGTGIVNVIDGTVGGGGIIGGSLITSGGVLAPGTGATTLTVKRRLGLNNGPYSWRVRTSSATADKVIARGVDLNGATLSGIALGHTALPPGTTFTIIDNTSRDPIIGTFSNLPDGGTITIGNNTFQANYEGGDGNDLTLTVVP